MKITGRTCRDAKRARFVNPYDIVLALKIRCVESPAHGGHAIKRLRLAAHVSLLGLILLISLSLTAQGRSLPEGVRPADFYRSVFQRDAAVCNTILKSLNIKHVMTPEQWNIGANPNYIGDLLLASELQVPWQRKMLEAGGVADSSLDMAKVDLSGNGHTRFVYRWAFFSLARTMNELFVSDSMPPEFRTGDMLPETTVQNLRGMEVRINARTVPQIWREVHEDTFDFNVLIANGKAFLAIIPALQADRAVERGSPLDLYVLGYRAPTDVMVVCKFASKKQKIEEKP